MNSLRIPMAALAALVSYAAVLPVLLMAAPFLLVRWASGLVTRLLEPASCPWEELIEFDQTLGWRPKAALSTHYADVDDVFSVSTDDQGWRGRNSLRESGMVVFGDSFAWGYGVGDGDLFTNYVSGVTVKTVGTMGYNMVQELLCMQQLRRELRGKIIVWFIYYGNDLFENLSPDMQGYRQPFLRSVEDRAKWEIVNHHLAPNRWFLKQYTRGEVYYEQLARFCSPNAHSARAYAACEFLLAQGKELCDQAGAELVVFTIPEKTQLSEAGRDFLLRHGGDPGTFDPDFPDRRIGEMCRQLGIRFRAGKADLSLAHYKAFDSHWNTLGHRRVGQILSEIYRGSGLQNSPAELAAPLVEQASR